MYRIYICKCACMFAVRITECLRVYCNSVRHKEPVLFSELHHIRNLYYYYYSQHPAWSWRWAIGTQGWQWRRWECCVVVVVATRQDTRKLPGNLSPAVGTPSLGKVSQVMSAVSMNSTTGSVCLQALSVTGNVSCQHELCNWQGVSKPYTEQAMPAVDMNSTTGKVCLQALSVTGNVSCWHELYNWRCVSKPYT